VELGGARKSQEPGGLRKSQVRPAAGTQEEPGREKDEPGEARPRELRGPGEPRVDQVCGSSGALAPLGSSGLPWAPLGSLGLPWAPSSPWSCFTQLRFIDVPGLKRASRNFYRHVATSLQQ
jgi:hypothetical protein